RSHLHRTRHARRPPLRSASGHRVGGVPHSRTRHRHAERVSAPVVDARAGAARGTRARRGQPLRVPRTARADSRADRGARSRRNHLKERKPMTYRVGVDVGGTFTDVLLINENTGETWRSKVPSTPEDQSIGVLYGIEKACEIAGVPLND